jgi:hypothetical protein
MHNHQTYWNNNSGKWHCTDCKANVDKFHMQRTGADSHNDILSSLPSPRSQHSPENQDESASSKNRLSVGKENITTTAFLANLKEEHERQKQKQSDNDSSNNDSKKDRTSST